MDFAKLALAAQKLGISDLKMLTTESQTATLEYSNGLFLESTSASAKVRDISGLRNGVAATIRVGSSDEASILALLPTLKTQLELKTKETEEEMLSPKNLTYLTYVTDSRFKAATNDQISQLITQLAKRLGEVPFLLKDKVTIAYQYRNRSESLINTKGLNLTKKINGLLNLIFVLYYNDGKDNASEYLQRSYRSIDEINLDTIITEFKALSKQLLPKKSLPSGTYQIVFAPHQFLELFQTLFGHLNARDVILTRSFWAKQLKKPVASTLITLYDAPVNAEIGLGITYDEDGYPTKNQAFIEHGVLQSFIHSQKTASQLNQANTGNAGSGRPELFEPYIKPGTSSAVDILKSVKKGVRITNMSGLHSGVNKANGDFSLQFSGNVITDGEVGPAITTGVISGNFFSDVLNKVQMVGNDLNFLHGEFSPTILIESLAVSTDTK